MPTEPSGSVWRLDTPPAVMGEAVSALVPADLADGLLTLKLTPGVDRVGLYATGGGETVPLVSVTFSPEAAATVRLLTLRYLHDLAAAAAGERFAV